MGLPRFKNLTRFSLFLSCCLLYAIVWNVLFPLFYVICEFHRFLHRGKAQIMDFPEGLNGVVAFTVNG